MPSASRRALRRAIDGAVGVLKFSALVTLAGCGPGTGADDGNGGTAGTSDTGGAGGKGGTGGKGGSSGSAGTAGSAGTGSGFACMSSAAAGELVEVPAGPFIMGCNSDVDDECLDDEMPMHTVTLAAFSIERTEVTQDAYAACVTQGACEEPSCVWNCDAVDSPATCVNVDQAKAYCAWAGRHLPSEAQWEKAARGADGAKFPWGNDAPDCTRANMDGCGNVVAVVGSYPDGASPYGALDMSGNMVEMVSDWYDATYYQLSPDTDPTGPASGERYGGRGGGFKSESTWQRTSKRDWYDLEDAGASLGFRCVL